MDQQLKQRLIGVTIIVALVVIFVPMFFGEADNTEGGSQDGMPPVSKEFMEQSLELPKTAEEVVVTKELEPSTSSNQPESSYKIIPLTDAPSEEAQPSQAEESIETVEEEGNVEKTLKPAQALKKPKLETPKSEVPPVKPKPLAKVVPEPIVVKPIPVIKQEPPKPVPVKPVPVQPVTTPAPALKPVPIMPAADSAGANVAWVIQTGSFTTEAKARALTEKLRLARYPAFMETVQNAAGTVYKVQVGPELDRGRAEQTQRSIESNMGIKGFIIPHQ